MFGPGNDLRANVVTDNAKTGPKYVNRYSDDLALCGSDAGFNGLNKSLKSSQGRFADKKSKIAELPLKPEYPQNKVVDLSPLSPLLSEPQTEHLLVTTSWER